VCNIDGVILQQCQYSGIAKAGNKFFITKKIERRNGQLDFVYYGLLNMNGETLIECEKRHIDVVDDYIVVVDKGRSTIYNTEAQRIVEHDSFTTAFRMSSATDAELEKLDTSHASSFITDFNTFTPDHVYNVYQSVSGGGNNSMGFYTSFKTTKNTYQMLVLPK
jgi:hypothetical protein